MYKKWVKWITQNFSILLFPRNSNFSSELNNLSHQPTSDDYLEKIKVDIFRLLCLGSRSCFTQPFISTEWSEESLIVCKSGRGVVEHTLQPISFGNLNKNLINDDN